MILTPRLPFGQSFLAGLPRCDRSWLSTVLLALVLFSRVNAATLARLAPRRRHTGNALRFLVRSHEAPAWLTQAQRRLLAVERKPNGRWIVLLDSTQVSHQSSQLANSFSTSANRPRRGKAKRRQVRYKTRYCRAFVFALVLSPSGVRIPFYRCFYTKAYCRQTGRTAKTQADLAAELLGKLPLPEVAKVVVVGDTAFDAGQVLAACQQRRWDWLVPGNPNRQLAGPVPRRTLRELWSETTACCGDSIRLQPGQGPWARYARASACREKSSKAIRTFEVHRRSVSLHSVGEVVALFSQAKGITPDESDPQRGRRLLLSNAYKASNQELTHWYALRWQIELFFKEMKTDLGMASYRCRRMEAVAGWVSCCVVGFLYLERYRIACLARRKKRGAGTRPRKREVKDKEYEAARTGRLRQAVRQELTRREQRELTRALRSPGGIRRVRRQLKRKLAADAEEVLLLPS